MNAKTEIRMIDQADGEVIRCTWAEFLDANRDMHPDELAHITEMLDGAGSTTIGGGASPCMSIEVCR